MRIRIHSGYLPTGIAGLAAFWLAISSATAETSTALDVAQAAEQKTSDDAEKNCDCPCTKASKAKKSRVIYVGPRQNVPLEIDED